MSNSNIIRAWKDPVYRNSLSERERAALPPNPAGAIEISDADLGKVVGGGLGPIDNSIGCSFGCPSYFACPTDYIRCSFLCPTGAELCGVA